MSGRSLGCNAWVALALLFCGTFARAQTDYAYFPSADVTDGRMITILGGTGSDVLTGDTVVFRVAGQASQESLEIGIFDGDTGGHWDQGNIPLQYSLYADPLGDGSGSGGLVASWSGSGMPDNDWFSVSVPQAESARAASGAYFYTLVIRHPDQGPWSWPNVKLRTDGALALLGGSMLTFNAAWANSGDAPIVYPDWPNRTPTTYDGLWEFFLDVPESTPHLVVWDGEWDYGSHDGQTTDTDDPDTPNTSAIPPWVQGSEAVPEGVAVGDGIGMGDPPDDEISATYRRDPSVFYEVIAPDGTSYLNLNPSGNQEWEQFRIENDPGIAADHYVTDPLEPGVYRLRVTGLDISNTVVLYSEYDILGVDSEGNPRSLPQIPEPGLLVFLATGTLISLARGRRS